MAAQPNGCYPRLNGGMMQTGNYQGAIVSLVGRVTDVNTLTAADGSVVKVDVDQLADNNGLMMVNQERVIEIIGMVADPTTITAFVCRDLKDMDINLYNTMITMMQQPKFAPYFGAQMTGVGGQMQ